MLDPALQLEEDHEANTMQAEAAPHLEELIACLEEQSSNLDQMLALLPQENHTLFLRLLSALGLKEGDILLPLLIAMQFYTGFFQQLSHHLRDTAEHLLESIPAELETLSVQIVQQNQDLAAQHKTDHEQLITAIAQQREQWRAVTAALLPELRQSFTTAKAEAIAAYEAETKTLAEQTKVEARQELKKNLGELHRRYLGDVIWQGVMWASGACVLAMVAIGGVMYWYGSQQGLERAQHQFVSKSRYDFAKAMVTNPENVKRFHACQEAKAAECTILMNNSQTQANSK